MFLILLVGMILAPGEVLAQGLEPANPRLNLGIAFGTFGEETTEVPLKLTFPRGMKVGKVQAEIVFPVDRLAFVSVSGTLASGGDVHFDSELKPVAQEGEEAGQGVLEIVAESSANPIPSGVLATLVFQISEEEKSEILALGLRGRLWAYPDVSQEITPVETYEGRVSIQEPAVFFACFFYMH